MRKFLKIVSGLALAAMAIIATLGLYNDYDVQQRAAVTPANPDTLVLRTPEARFQTLTDFRSSLTI